MWMNIPKMVENFKTGEGLEWGNQHPCLFEGTERFFKSGYIANLMTNWIPALEGVEAKLKAGAKVADVGCGLGASTILMAQAFPKSKFVGFDYHDGSIAIALAHKGPALGAQAGEARLRSVIVEGGGFKRFRRATQTPFNLVLEARP